MGRSDVQRLFFFLLVVLSNFFVIFLNRLDVLRLLINRFDILDWWLSVNHWLLIGDHRDLLVDLLLIDLFLVLRGDILLFIHWLWGIHRLLNRSDSLDRSLNLGNSLDWSLHHSLGSGLDWGGNSLDRGNSLLLLDHSLRRWLSIYLLLLLLELRLSVLRSSDNSLRSSLNRPLLLNRLLHHSLLS